MFRNVGKEAESEMHLITLRPVHTANARLKIDEGLLITRRRTDRNKEALGFSLLAANLRARARFVAAFTDPRRIDRSRFS